MDFISRSYREKVLARWLYILLLLHSLSLATGDESTNKIDITPIQSNGVFFEHQGYVQTFNDYSNLTFKINITFLYDRLKRTRMQHSETKQICSKVDELYCSMSNSSESCKSALTYNCHQLLLFIKKDLDKVQSTLDTFFAFSSNKRSKRYLLDGGSQVMKFLFGTPSSDDYKRYSRQIDILKSFQTIEQQNFEKMSTYSANLQTLLNESYTSLTQKLQSTFKNNMEKKRTLHPSIISKAEFLENILKTLPLPKDLSYPVDLTEENMPILWRISKINVFFNQAIFISLQVPLVHRQKYELVQVHSLPVIEENVQILPLKSKFYLFGENNQTFLPLNDTENCKSLNKTNKICFVNEGSQKITDSNFCEVGLRFGRHSNCDLQTILTEMFVVLPLDNNRWILMATSQQKYSSVCSGNFEKGNLSPGVYSLVMDEGCSFKINSKSLYTSEVSNTQKHYFIPEIKIFKSSVLKDFVEQNFLDYRMESLVIFNEKHLDDWDQITENIEKDKKNWDSVINWNGADQSQSLVHYIFLGLVLLVCGYFIGKKIRQKKDSKHVEKTDSILYEKR
uniref:Envelope fusion protein n=1 Tax=Megaselia scalaris TaxID=36166 RepID=T1GHP5_MEGSC